MRVAGLVLLVGTSAAKCRATRRVASGKPLATLDRDIDGDGTVDHVEVDQLGSLHIPGAPSLPLAPNVTAAKLDAGSVKGKPVIVVELDDSTGQEVVIFERGTAGWRRAGQAPIGGVGLDHDYAIQIAVTPDGIYRYQARAGYARCDGKPAYLFAEGWTGTKFQRLAKVPIDIADSAPVIAAHVDTATPATPLLYHARVASHEPGASDAGALGIPTELDDGKLTTVWHEDFAASAGEGQFFTFTPRFAGAKAAQLRIVPAGKTFERPHRLGVVGAHGAWHVDLPDVANDAAGTAYVADLPAPIDGCVTVVIESAYGSDRGTTGLAELEVFAEGERTGGGEAALAHVVATGSDGATAAARALARRGAMGVTALDGELAKATDVGARTRLVGALVQTNDPTAGPPLAHAIAQGWVHDRTLDEAIAALGPLGQTHELHEIAAGDLGIETRIAAVHALAAHGELAVDLAGRGPRELRHAVIEILSGVPIASLVHEVETVQDPAAAGDLWRAITRRAHGNAGERPAALAAMSAALATTTDYERRYRLIDGIATIGDGAALDALAKLLATLPAGAERAAFAQMAARAIAVNPRPDALVLVLALAHDDDPGVRLAALTALAGADAGVQGPWHAADGPDGIDRAIMTPLASDPWPEVRRRAAQVLGDRCMRPGPAHALAASIGRDPDLDVRGDALAALVQCKASGAGELLAHVWNDAKSPLELRQRAVDLSVVLGDRALGAKLVPLLATWRGRALESAEALALAQNAAYALGRLAPAGAADALLAALDDGAFPEIVGAAASALGLLGPACPAAAKTKLRALAHSEEQQISVPAAHAAAQCGK